MSPRRGRGFTARVHSLSCTDDEWNRTKARAQRRGMSISRYMVERALNVDPRADPPPRLVLDESEQRDMHERIALIAERTLAGTGSSESIIRGLRNAVGFLVDTTMREIVRAGRAGEMRAILESLFGAGPASSIVERYHDRMKQGGLPT